MAGWHYTQFMSKFAHQGDIVFVPFKNKVTGDVQKHSGSFIVGYGEATGHHHKVHCDDMQVLKTDKGYILVLGSQGRVTHQEHKDIVLSPGTYVVEHEREKDWFSLATRRVVD